MDHILTNIQLGINIFLFYVVLITILLVLWQVVRHKYNLVRLGLNYAFLFYICCVFTLTFFPLPTLAEQATLSGYQFQAVPFHFLCDIVRETPFVWNQPKTYIAALLNRAVLQVVFNVFMTIPFGMYLRYNFQFNGKGVMAASFALSALIEIGQLTGLFFNFNGSYRLCDVDDLILNTLGGVIGYMVIKLVEKYLPAIEKFDKRIAYRVYLPFSLNHKACKEGIASVK